MDPVEGIGLAAAAFAAGVINAVAGGGSLISFPALVAAGYGSKVANVTNTVALWPGYAGGVAGYRRELSGQGQRALALAVPALIGAAAGSAILLGTPEDTFEAVVPGLIAFASLLLLFQERIARLTVGKGAHAMHVRPPLWVITMALGAYGAYFGAGLGIMTLAVLGILLPDDLQRSNALKGFLTLVTNSLAFVWFAAFGPVAWTPAAVMAGASLAGGYLGAGAGRRLGRRRLRWAVIVYGFVAALILALR